MRSSGLPVLLLSAANLASSKTWRRPASLNLGFLPPICELERAPLSLLFGSGMSTPMATSPASGGTKAMSTEPKPPSDGGSAEFGHGVRRDFAAVRLDEVRVATELERAAAARERNALVERLAEQKASFEKRLAEQKASFEERLAEQKASFEERLAELRATAERDRNSFEERLAALGASFEALQADLRVATELERAAAARERAFLAERMANLHAA